MSERLTDAQWALIAPLLPPPTPNGRPRADDRRTVDAILFVLRHGVGWSALPRQLGHGSTAWRRLNRWEADGTWERIWRAFLSSLDAHGKLSWAEAFLDGSFVPAKKGGPVSD